MIVIVIKERGIARGGEERWRGRENEKEEVEAAEEEEEE